MSVSPEDLRRFLRGRGWRLGTTSCFKEAPLVDNVRALAGAVDDVELVLFDAPQGNNWPSPAQVRELSDLAERYRLSFTPHIPCHLGHISLDSAWLRRSLEWVRRSVDLLESLHPLAYVWHWEAEQFGAVPARDLTRWLDSLRELAGAVAAERLIEPRRLAVETLSYPFDLIAALVEEHDFGVTMDVGHLWRGGYDWRDFWQRWAPRGVSVHLHGVNCKGDDHLGLDALNPALLQCFMERLSDAPSVSERLGDAPSVSERLGDATPSASARSLSVEVFSELEWCRSLASLQRLRYSP